MSKLPKIAKPRPVKWKKPFLWGNKALGFYVDCVGYGGEYRSGPTRTTKASAIRAWNKQESKR